MSFTPYSTHAAYSSGSSRPTAPTQRLHSVKFQVERKTLFLDLGENARGRFLRITEEVHGRRNAVVVPESGLADLLAAVQEILDQIDS